MLNKKIPMQMYNTFTKKVKTAGFTLLEVLVALAVLSISGLLIIRTSGAGLTQLARTGWEDQAMRLGRNQMIRLMVESPDRLEQWGTLAPEMPHAEWRSQRQRLHSMPAETLLFQVSEGSGQSRREIVLECLLPSR